MSAETFYKQTYNNYTIKVNTVKIKIEIKNFSYSGNMLSQINFRNLKLFSWSEIRYGNFVKV